MPERKKDEQRDEKQRGDQTDTTLMKYFFPEENMNRPIQEHNIRQGTPTTQKTFEKMNPEKIQNFFRKPFKLRNALKQCYWDRQPLPVKVS